MQDKDKMHSKEIEGKAVLKVDSWLVATKCTDAPSFEIFKLKDSRSA